MTLDGVIGRRINAGAVGMSATGETSAINVVLAKTEAIVFSFR